MFDYREQNADENFKKTLVIYASKDHKLYRTHRSNVSSPSFRVNDHTIFFLSSKQFSILCVSILNTPFIIILLKRRDVYYIIHRVT